ncbi:MAG: hypothetical protein M1606_01025, partial [Candidatus Thermoplasmatota archaeon]|nr:hypothetical protein [Candidatus Thermoplasmatota archaeon]
MTPGTDPRAEQGLELRELGLGSEVFLGRRLLRPSGRFECLVKRYEGPGGGLRGSLGRALFPRAL